MATSQPKPKRRRVERPAQSSAGPAQPSAHNAAAFPPTAFAATAVAPWPYYTGANPAWGNESAYVMHRMTPDEELQLLQQLETERASQIYFSPEDMRLLRKLHVSQFKRDNGLPQIKDVFAPTGLLSPEPPPSESGKPDPAVLDALYSIQSTPFENSFLSRLGGSEPSLPERFTYRDWESRAPWMDVMDDLWLHWCLSHPGEAPPFHSIAPIDYAPLTSAHLSQVHGLLSRAFWPGVDVSDCCEPENEPDKCTVVATYKRLVVGVALLSGPRVGYLMYLAVRAGWDGAGIATVMLHQLVTNNPETDITLHVSANNPAMLLYNRFGFKAEEFVVGFYDEYLPRNSKACKNAFRLRLRR